MNTKYSENVDANSTVKQSDIRKELKNIILDKGLTENETEDLLSYWVDGETDSNGHKTDLVWFENRNNKYAQVIYFINQSKYDEMLFLEIEPEVDDIIRVGVFSVSDIPIIRSE